MVLRSRGPCCCPCSYDWRALNFVHQHSSSQWKKTLMAEWQLSVFINIINIKLEPCSGQVGDCLLLLGSLVSTLQAVHPIARPGLRQLQAERWLHPPGQVLRMVVKLMAAAVLRIQTIFLRNRVRSFILMRIRI